MATTSLTKLLARGRGWGSFAPWRSAAGATACVGAFYAGGPSARSSCDDGHGRSHGQGGGHAHAHDVPRERDHLIFGVPKKGRLHDKVAKMLQGAGIEYTRKERVDITQCSNLPMSIVFLPASDIPAYVGEGEVDLGITGEDMVAESMADVHVLMQLGFGKCNLSVQAPKDQHLEAESLAGKRIVTSFPNITRAFFTNLEREGCPTQIKCISGSVEAACGLGLADGIVDLVETGTTMRAAGLEEVTTIMKSQSVLIINPNSKHPELIEVVRKRIEGYLMAQSWVMVSYNVHRSNLIRAQAITPGKTSPSVQPLENKNWIAVTALVPKATAAAVMDNLEVVGATEIFLTALLSTRMG